jgi:ferritin-like metal-binding protein YciE
VLIEYKQKLKTLPTMATTKTATRTKKAPETTDVIEDSALYELFLDELKDIYWAEKHLVKALPKMVKAATSNELKGAIETHIAETENHITRLESAFASIDEKAVAVKCEAMAGLLKEADEIVSETEKGTLTRDAGIISAAQKVEHYEIASYGTLRTLALTLGYVEAADLLQATLDEEKNCDSLLTQIAEAGINDTAKTEKE